MILKGNIKYNAVFFLLLFVMGRAVSVHVYFHEDGDHHAHCNLCDHAVLINKLPMTLTAFLQIAPKKVFLSHRTPVALPEYAYLPGPRFRVHFLRPPPGDPDSLAT